MTDTLESSEGTTTSADRIATEIMQAQEHAAAEVVQRHIKDGDMFIDLAPAQSVKKYANFSMALDWIKMGMKARRSKWSGFGQFVFLVQGSEFLVSRPPLLGPLPEGTQVRYRPHIDLFAVDGTCGTWTPNMADILANDWEVVL